MVFIPLFIATMNKLRNRSMWLRISLTACLLTFSCTVFSANNDTILLVHDGKNELVQDIIQSLSQRLSSKSIHIDLLDASTQPLPDNAVLKNYISVITLGAQTAQIALERNPPVSILSLLVSKQAWLLINPQKSTYSRSVIVLDQPISRQFLLLREIYGQNNRIGVLLGPYSSTLQPELLDAARPQQNLSVKIIQNNEELIPALNNLIEQIDLLLAVPDPIVYNKRSIQGILLLTYRNKTPVIGFSQAYSRAGAMVSLYSDADNIAQQAAELVLDKAGNDRVYSPRYFSISYNQQVARALGYTLPDEHEIIDHIYQKEKLYQ